ncbi:hypothetical protein ABZ690_35225 [Streptomyces sp. NPDC006967]|uniref:hypothetical protein n=1 Tax=unclassified Streptomyces TaxID=2593676 RepID=UPI0015E1603F|nr:hypothetical protein [Streptomyces sp. SM1]
MPFAVRLRKLTAARLIGGREAQRRSALGGRPTDRRSTDGAGSLAGALGIRARPAPLL